MAQMIARAAACPLRLRGELGFEIARFAIIAGSAIALIMAGPSLPL